jgi:hypothetical protein
MEDFNNYEINWKDAPEWALAHAFDKNGIGYFYGLIKVSDAFCAHSKLSEWVIGSEVLKIHEETWTKSLTFRQTID